MAINYPASLDGTTQLPQPSGTSLLTSPDHAAHHTNVSILGTAIEAVLGTTAGTSVLKNFAIGDFATRENASGVFQFTHTGGTSNNMIFGSPTIMGGTITGQIQNNGTINGVIGTPTLLMNGTQGDVYYRSVGGSIVNLSPGTSGQFLQTQGTGANPKWSPVSSPIIAIYGTIADNDTDATANNAWATVISNIFTPANTGTIMLWGNAEVQNNSSAAYAFLRLAIDGTQVGAMGRADMSGASKIQTIAVQGTFAGLSAAAHTVSVQINNTDGGGAGTAGTAFARRSSLTAYVTC